MTIITRTFFLLCAGVVWNTSCLAADWPAFRGNLARTGYYPDPAGCPSGAPSWKISLGAPVISSPVVYDGMLYIGARDSCIYAIDCATGEIIWKKKTGGWVDATPLVERDRVIAGSRDSIVYVLDRRSGTLLGSLKAGVQLSSPVITIAREILTGVGLPKAGVSAYGRNLSAQDINVPQWSVPLPQFTYSSPAINGQAVVVGATDGTLYGIDAGTRKTAWKLPTDGVIYLSTPAISDTTVYFAPGDEDRNVYAVSLLTGKVIWKSERMLFHADSSDVLAKQSHVRILAPEQITRLLGMSPSLRLRTIRALQSRGMDLPRIPLWKKTADARDSSVLEKRATVLAGEFIPLGGMKTSSVAVSTDNVYVIQKDLGFVLTGDSLTLYKQQYVLQALDRRTGGQKWSFTDWRFSSEHGYCSSPVATRNIVFFGWGEGRMYGLDAKTGDKLWEDSLQGHILSSPALAKGMLYVATLEGNLYSYQLSATAPGIDFQRSTYCYPNPAKSGVSHIQVYVAKRASCSIVVCNAAEKPVFRVNRIIAAGEKFTHDWDLGHVANGMYYALVKVKYDDGNEEKKILKMAILN